MNDVQLKGSKTVKKTLYSSDPLKIIYPYTQNPFESLFIDITNRCNMSCNFCYNPNRSQADMSLEYFKKICSDLPFPVAMKIGGGEPTLHPQLPDFIRTAHRHRHTVYIASNGLRYADRDFMQSLKQLRKEGITFSLGISMDGGYSNRAAYEHINGFDSLSKKMEAFHALVESGLGRVCLTAIILRGINEDVVPQLVSLAQKHTKAVRYIHFRNATKTGLWLETKPYTLEEMIALAKQHFRAEQFLPRCFKEVHCTPEEGRKCCYRFRPNKRLQISLIEFDSGPSLRCPKRGRILCGVDGIQPFFMSMH